MQVFTSTSILQLASAVVLVTASLACSAAERCLAQGSRLKAQASLCLHVVLCCAAKGVMVWSSAGSCTQGAAYLGEPTLPVSHADRHTWGPIYVHTPGLTCKDGDDARHGCSCSIVLLQLPVIMGGCRRQCTILGRRGATEPLPCFKLVHCNLLASALCYYDAGFTSILCSAACYWTLLHRQPVQQLSSGSFNFCRFALLEPGQTSSSCYINTRPAAYTVTQERPCSRAEVVIEGFTNSSSASALAAAGSNASTAAAASSNAGGLVAVQEGGSSSSIGGPARKHGLLSMRLREQQQQLVENLSLSGSNRGVVDGAAAAAATAAGAAAASAAHEDDEGGSGDDDDLTEAAEEQLVLSTATGSDAAASSSGCRPSAASTPSVAKGGSGPCYLALPSEDAANVGVWQLSLCRGADSQHSSSSSINEGGGAGSHDGPVMLLKQTKSPDRPSRGLCMAVVLLQPRVRV